MEHELQRMKRSTPHERKARDWRHNDRPGRAWDAAPIPSTASGEMARKPTHTPAWIRA
jgi:hypothetical protein